MKDPLPDIKAFERRVFKRRNVLACLLSFSRKLMQARQAGLVYGTDASLSHFLPPGIWDRGVMDKFSGKGLLGVWLKLFGRYWVRFQGMSPIHLYRTDEFGERIENEGVTAYTLRNHQGFYDQGIKILLIDKQGLEKQVLYLVNSQRIQLGFRAGMSQGRALVGPLGSQKRKIITAIGEIVDLASRLESCGEPNHLHTTKALAAQLQEAWISRDTMWIYKTTKKLEGIQQWNHKNGFSFLDFYKTVFHISKDPVCKKGDNHYKEFSMSDTRLIKCLPETDRVTCAGI